MTEDADWKNELERSLLLPIRQIETYANLLEALLNDYKEKILFTEDFKTVALVEIEVKKLLKSVVEHYNLNSMKGSMVRTA